MLIFSFSVYYWVRYKRLPIREIRMLAADSLKTIILLLPLLFFNSFASAVEKWTLKKESEGIKIYTATIPKSNVKALRVELTTSGTPAQLADILMNIEKQKEWVYGTETSVVLKKISNTELIYYTEKDLPWPVINRDAVMHLKIAHNTTTHVMNISVSSVKNFLPVKEDIVRVPSSTVNWVVTPLSSNTIKIEYEVVLDPGGSVPAWVVNMCTTKGPFETFKKLKKMLG